MKRSHTYICLIFSLVCWNVFSQQQRAFVTFEYDSGNFPESHSCTGFWLLGKCTKGHEAHFNSLYVYQNNITTGSVYRSYALLPYSTKTTDSLRFNGNTLTVDFRLTFTYKSWGDQSGPPDYYADPISKNIVISGTVPTVYDDLNFTGITPSTDRWRIKYRVKSVSPFQPDIISDPTNKCAGSVFDIHIDPNYPAFFEHSNKNNTFEWQYGQIETVIRKNRNFEDTQRIINDYLQQAMESADKYNKPDNIDNIYQFILNAPYSSFKEFQKNMTPGKDYFAMSMTEWRRTFDAGNDPYYSALTYKDINFLDLYLYDAAKVAYEMYPYYPFDIKDEVVWHLHPSTAQTLSFLASDFYSFPASQSTVYFRVRAKRGNEYGPWSVAETRTVKPAPPVIDMDQISVEPSCSGGKTGKISLNSITGPVRTRNYTYRVGDADSCTLVDINDETTCGWTAFPREFSGQSLVIHDVPAGKSKIYITYKDGKINNCFTEGQNVIIIDVPALPELSVTTEKSDVLCQDEATGQIIVNVNQGSGDYKFGLYQNGQPYTQCDSLIEDARAVYSDLPKGDFTVKAFDKCKVPKIDNLIINEPVRASITNATTIETIDPACTSPANGRIDSLVVSGPANFTYLVNGEPYSRQIWRDGIPAGTYTIDVLDADRPSCPGDRIVKTLNPPAPLQIGTVAVTDLRCFGVPEGEIEAGAGSGGSRSLQYRLYRLSDNTTFTHPSRIFTDLQAGEYRLTLRNTDNRCADTVYRILTVQTPPEPVALLVGDSVRCHGENNGKIICTVTGGTGAYTPIWQQKNAADFWMPRTLNLNSLSPGDYRLSATDANNCSFTSNAVTIGEPLPIIGVSRLNDIRCFGEKGRITVNAAGGNGRYLFEYDRGSGYTRFPTDSMLDAGVYSVRVTDRKGCTRPVGSGLTITAPPSPLAFTCTASDYNGFNISCFGNNDGHAGIPATGGNGASYSGYTYSMNTLVQADNPLFDRLTAGSYIIKVCDARGCEVIRNLAMTQPAAGLTFAAPLIKDVTCYDHTDGSITLSPLGGTAPFTYRIGSDDFTASALFEGLGAGEYDFTVRDVNGCLWRQQFPVTHQVPKMEIDGVVSNVNCFGGNDGSIAIGLSGGRSPIRYLWKETGSTTRDVSMLTVGSYTLLAADDAGCRTEKTFAVDQPLAPLTLSVSAKPVCAGVSLGYIRPRAAAGTPPYLYAVDNSQGFAPQNEFPALPGIHPVFALDANGCRTETNIEVEVKNRMPSVNFMAATMRYAMDTLVFKEVNVPKPDSVEWRLAPGMYMTGGDEFSPVVTADTPGQYTVRMTGWFEGCDYTIEKMLQFSDYDPLAIPCATKGNGISSVELYPNPNTGEFQVKVSLFVKQQVMIKVVDMTSGVWFTEQYAPTETAEEYINITKAPPGVYLLTVIAEHDIQTVRVVKQ